MLPVFPLRLDFKLSDAVRLPEYPGSLWRSAFGASLRAQACITGAATCAGCPLLDRCAYGFLFDTPQPKHATGLVARYPQLPHPYVISPRHAGGRHPKGAVIAVDVILIASGHEHLAGVLAAARNLKLGRTPVQLAHITLLPPVAVDARPATLAEVLDAQPTMPQPPPAPEHIAIHIEHPLRLRRDNQYLSPGKFDFGTFFTALARRVSMLTMLSEAKQPDADYAALAALARRTTTDASQLAWFDWSRRSTTQSRRVPMGGVTGTFKISGDIAPLWPWLWAGQWLHAGKGAVMGLGRYHLESAP